MTVFCALYRSYPAANALPRVGVRPFGESFLINKGGQSSTFVVGGAAGVLLGGAAFAEDAIFGGEEVGAIFGRLVMGETEGEGMSWPGGGSV